STLPICPPRLMPVAPVFPVLSVGCNAGEAPTCRAEDLTGKRRPRKGKKEGTGLCWELAEAAARGRSGGPLVNGDGYLVGVGTGAAEGKGYYIHLAEVHRFLAQHSFRWLCGDEGQQ